MAAITLAADDFDVDGPVPADAWFKFRRYRLDRRGPRLGSELAWTVALDDGGNATTELPADQPGNAIVITSNYPGFTQVTVAGYPEDVGTLSALLAYEVDPATLRTSSSAAAAWTLAVDRVGVLVAAAVGYVAAAAASALDSARSALASSDSARSSGTSAFNAGQSAATSLGHANDSADAAAASSLSAATAVGVANTSVVSAFIRAVGEQARLIFQRKNGDEFDVGDIRGPQGLPGSTVPWGAFLGTSDLDTVIAVGVYQQSSGANASLANHYPLASHPGILEVFQEGTTASVLQRFTPRAGGAHAVRGIYLRRRQSNVWEQWRFVASQRVDQSAGRAIYTWDDLNGREQLVYGDTGWRDIAVIGNSADLTVTVMRIRRVGSTVFLAFDVTPRAVTPAASELLILNLPSGFALDAPAILRKQYLDTNNTQRQVRVNSGSLNLSTQLAAMNPGNSLRFYESFSTTAAWPSILPGSASGTIPNL